MIETNLGNFLPVEQVPACLTLEGHTTVIFHEYAKNVWYWCAMRESNNAVMGSHTDGFYVYSAVENYTLVVLVPGQKFSALEPALVFLEGALCAEAFQLQQALAFHTQQVEKLKKLLK